ncbi:MAG TPA: rhodanese-like domain-containing protein [Aggregatilineaceae bacterium]|nr:rhodanese-like domain-containing protein [Aggregatilineaceae bacterium]
MEKVASESLVTMTPAADCRDAHAFFLNKLSYETDPSDVYADMKNGVADFVLLDVRSPKAYVRSHAVGAVNLPQSHISETTTAELSRDKLMVVYCWGPGCNGATKAAAKLSALGFHVKEMIGGIEYWEDRERYPVERGTTGAF